MLIEELEEALEQRRKLGLALGVQPMARVQHAGAVGLGAGEEARDLTPAWFQYVYL